MKRKRKGERKNERGERERNRERERERERKHGLCRVEAGINPSTRESETDRPVEAGTGCMCVFVRCHLRGGMEWDEDATLEGEWDGESPCPHMGSPLPQ